MYKGMKRSDVRSNVVNVCMVSITPISSTVTTVCTTWNRWSNLLRTAIRFLVNTVPRCKSQRSTSCPKLGGNLSGRGSSVANGRFSPNRSCREFDIMSFVSGRELYQGTLVKKPKSMMGRGVSDHQPCCSASCQIRTFLKRSRIYSQLTILVTLAWALLHHIARAV
jgi:hypothetical protein